MGVEKNAQAFVPFWRENHKRVKEVADTMNWNNKQLQSALMK